MSNRTCTVPGCGRTHSAKGYCNTHYASYRRGRPLGAIKAQTKPLARDAHGNKQCANCREWQPVDQYATSTKNADGLDSRCRRCWRAAFLLSLYGITIEQYEALLAAQGGVCAICGGVSTDGKSLHVDHDHNCCNTRPACGACVRGLLCDLCNRAIGSMQDDPARLRAAAAYLEQRAVVAA